MRILISNLGSTSFKFRLYEMDANQCALLAKGGYERVTDHGDAIDQCLNELRNGGHLSDTQTVDAVGFKTVLGKNLSGCVDADQSVIDALEGFADVAPAHNPPYAKGIKRFSEKMPGVRLIALFETAFYQWVPAAASRYAIPRDWHEAGLRRYGFHGASHKFIAERSAELLERHDIAEVVRGLYTDGPKTIDGKPLRVISCHLGGSSSVTGILNGVACGTSMGFSPQSGLPQNNRVGDLDSMAVPFLNQTLGIPVAEIERRLNRESGLLGVSGVSNDIRDIRAAAANGNADARLALDLLVHSIRHWVGAFLLQMGGCDALVFTAGIGENGPELRAAVCEGLSDLGIEIDQTVNAAVFGKEASLHSANSRTKILVIPANEEEVIAREVFRRVSA